MWLVDVILGEVPVESTRNLDIHLLAPGSPVIAGTLGLSY